jgi:serine/threonine protein kinase
MLKKFEEETEGCKNVLNDPTLLLQERIPDTLVERFQHQTLLPPLAFTSLVASKPSSEFFAYDTPTVISEEALLKTEKDSLALSAAPLSSSFTDSTSSSWQYRADEEIARGGMGVIFKGCQMVLNREVALKACISERVNPFQREHFIEESKITAYLDHPNIVPVYDLGTSATGEIILVMKLIRGVSWREVMHQFPPEKHLEKHLEILLQVCNAVAFAHSKKIVHNDLKPENIMVGEFGEVFVMDWGIATSIIEPLESNPFRVHKAHIDSARGTPLYMPPELAQGQGMRIGPWTDVYLLGGILYEILSGNPPHEGKTLNAILYFIQTQPPRELPTGVSKELKQICSKALAKAIEERYRTVLEFKEALEQFLKHRESLLIMEEACKILEECTRLNTIESIEEIEAKASQSKKCLGSKAPQTEIKPKADEIKKLQNVLYERYAEAIAGFRQAFKLHPQNESSSFGEWKARFEYAKTALRYNDFGLAETQLKQIPNHQPEYEELQKAIQQTQEERRIFSISQRFFLIYFLVLLTVVPEILLVGAIAFSFWWTGQDTYFLGIDLTTFEMKYPPFQLFNTSLFLSISDSFLLSF